MSDCTVLVFTRFCGSAHGFQRHRRQTVPGTRHSGRYAWRLGGFLTCQLPPSTPLERWAYLHNPDIICHKHQTSMANNPPIPPPLISVPRIRTLIASLVVSLGSGTNYVSNVSLIPCDYESKILNFTRSIQVRSHCRGGTSRFSHSWCWLSLCVAYSPQLGTRLKISHTQLNIVALAANGAESIWLEHSTSILPDTFQSGFTALVHYGDELWILVVLAYPSPAVSYSF